MKCASVVTDPAVREHRVSPITSSVICGSPATWSADNNEGAPVRDMVSCDADDARPANVSGSPSLSVLPSLATNDMVVTRSKSNLSQQLHELEALDHSKILHKKYQLHVKLSWISRSQILVACSRHMEESRTARHYVSKASHRMIFGTSSRLLGS